MSTWTESYIHVTTTQVLKMRSKLCIQGLLSKATIFIHTEALSLHERLIMSDQQRGRKARVARATTSTIGRTTQQLAIMEIGEIEKWRQRDNIKTTIVE